MAKFSKKSLEVLAGCHDDLWRLFIEVVKTRDCSIICGYRPKEEQQAAYDAGNSNAKPGQSPHNADPAMAVDVMPYPIDWKDEAGIYEFRNFVDVTAKRMNIELHPLIKFRNKKGQLIIDLPHYQLAAWRKT